MVTGSIYKTALQVVEYSGTAGTETRAVLTKVPTIHGGVVYTLNMGDTSPASTPQPTSVEKTVALHVPTTHTKIKDVKTYLMNGIMGNNVGDCELSCVRFRENFASNHCASASKPSGM